MPVIFEDALNTEISKGKIAPVYLLFGDDPYLKKFYADKISEKSYDGDPFFNLCKFEGDADLQQVYDATAQMPMMADKKCVTLTDYDFEHASKSDFDKLCTLLCETNDDCVLVLRFDSVEFDYKRASKAKKLIAAAEKGGGRAVCLDHRRPAQLIKMLTDGAAKRKCSMDSSVARYVVETVGDDISTLKNELDKLCGLAAGGVIDKSAVDSVCVKSVEASVYDYMKQVLACNLEGALRLLDELFFMRIEPMIILHTAASSYIDIYRVHAARKSGVAIQQVAKDFGYKNRAFVLERAASDLKKLDSKRISLGFEAILEAERGLKSTGLDPRVVLEQLTVRLVYIIIKGDSVD